jgi:hypothetical protein
MHLLFVIPITAFRTISSYIGLVNISDLGLGDKKMIKNRIASLTALILLTFFWTLPAFGLVIEGPALNLPEAGWSDFGLLIRAETDTKLLSVEFPNQGLADVIQLRRHSDGAVLASIPVPAGNNNAIVNISYPLTANETYELVATTSGNRYGGYMGVLTFPVTNPELTVLASYLDGNLWDLVWCAFNNITTIAEPTDPGPTEPQFIEAVIDIKPGSDINYINLKSKGLVPVAILTTDDMDALTVDLNSIIFAGAQPVKWVVQDIDGDGNNDLLLHFKTADLSDLSSSSTEAVLTGAIDSTPFIGKDSVKILQ